MNENRREVEKAVFSLSGVGILLASVATFLGGFATVFTLSGSTSEADSQHFETSSLVALALCLTGVAALRFATKASPWRGVVPAGLAAVIFAARGPWAWPYPDREYFGGVNTTNPWKISATHDFALMVIPGVLLLAAVLVGIVLRVCEAKGVQVRLPKVPRINLRSRRVLGVVAAPFLALALLVVVTPKPGLVEQQLAAQLAAGDIFSDAVQIGENGTNATYTLAPVLTASEGLQIEDSAPILKAIYDSAGLDLDLVDPKVKGGTATYDTASNSYTDSSGPALTLSFTRADLPEEVADTSWFTQSQTTYQAVLPIEADKLGRTKTSSKVYHLVAARQQAGALGSLRLPASSPEDVIVRWTKNGWVSLPGENDGKIVTSEADQPGTYTVITPDPDSKLLQPAVRGLGTGGALVVGEDFLVDEGTLNDNDTPLTATVSLTDSSGARFDLKAQRQPLRSDLLVHLPGNVEPGAGLVTVALQDGLGSTGAKTTPVVIQAAR